MDNYIIVYNYFSILIIIFILFLSGILIFKRITTQTAAHLILPAGSIFGICLNIFLLNLTAHLIKGVPGIIIALCIQIFLTYLILRIPSLPLSIPKGRDFKILFFLSLLWIIFSYQIAAHANTDGADSTLHQSLAARFIKGDYPMHQPWQPDYLAYYHFGPAELLGSLHALSDAPYYFIHPFISFWLLLFVSQILTWLIPPKEITFKTTLIKSLPTLVGLISLGGFFIIWPVRWELPSFLGQLPTLNTSFEVYGSPANLDGLVFFIHRFLSISFFISLLVPLIYPKNSKLLLICLVVYIGAIALTDESVLIVTLIPILVISYFNIFNRSFKKFLISTTLVSLIILFQGGIITQTILNHDGNSSFLIFPPDQKNVTEKYQSYRLAQERSKLFLTDDKLKTFNWLHIGIIWQLLICLSLVVYLFKKTQNRELTTLCILLLVSGIISLIAYHGLVPNGYTHPNGNRFLTLSYYLSGLCLAFFLVFWFSQRNEFKKIKYILNFFIVLILLASILPPLLQMFPRRKENWLVINPHYKSSLVNWIDNNISLNQRLVALTDIRPSNSTNIDLVKETGILTPVWAPTPRVHDSFDISPTYSDLYYTLNPEIIKELKINYLLISGPYFSQLPKNRQQDFTNNDFFKPVFTLNDNSIIILEVKHRYFSEGKDLDGTFNQLGKIAPRIGTYCLDYPPNITENVYRILKLLLYDRRTYCDHGGAFYNARVDVELNPRTDNPAKYDYLVLGKDVDPETICHCQAELIWEGMGNGVRFWRTKY